MLRSIAAAPLLEVDCASARNIFAATTLLSFTAPSARRTIMAANKAILRASAGRNRIARLFNIGSSVRMGDGEIYRNVALLGFYWQ